MFTHSARYWYCEACCCEKIGLREVPCGSVTALSRRLWSGLRDQCTEAARTCFVGESATGHLVGGDAPNCSPLSVCEP